MLYKWVVWLAVTGVAYAAGNQCDSEEARECYEDLVQYETIVFPLYGENEAKLDDTCGNMNMSFHCIGSYVETCLRSPECDKNCTKLIKDIHNFLRITGLIKLYDNLCDKGNALRQTYLENTECLENTADMYAACHNVSQESRHYIHTTKGANTVEANCCYMFWYRDCFTNATKVSCGENASIIVSIAVHYLLGDIAAQLCSSEPAFCDKPPLPPDGFTIDDEIDADDPGDNELDKDKPGKTQNETDNAIDRSEIDNEIDTNNPGDNKLDKGEIDKAKDGGSMNAAVTLYASTMLVLPCVFSILFRYVL